MHITHTYSRMARSQVLMIVDVQRAFSPPPEYLRKLKWFSSKFELRIFTQFINPPDSHFRRILKHRCCTPGTDEIELLMAPSPKDIVLRKISRYGLSYAHIRQIKRMGIRDITICGLDTNAWVLGIMSSLIDGGIRCKLQENMCWSSSGLHGPAVRIAREQFRYQ